MYKNVQFVIKALKYFISCFIENVLISKYRFYRKMYTLRRN